MSTKTIVIYQDLIKSEAFLNLSRKSTQVYLLLRCKCQVKPIKGKQKKYTIINNGELIFTYSEAKDKYHLSSGQFKRAIDQLTEFGFIQIKSVGGLNNTSNTYKLLENWKNYGTDKFVPPQKPEKRYSCIGFQPNNKHGKNSKSN